jgi:Protein of unknown function (DUF3551)
MNMVCGGGPAGAHFRRLGELKCKRQTDDDGSETAMRAPIIMLVAIAASLLGETQAGNAQSPYSYPWCAIPSGGDNSGGGAMSCHYTSRQQCMTTLSGIGGSCVASPYYHAQLTPLPNPSSVKPRHRRHVSL